MKILAVIPARMGSSRFPGKPLAKINGKEMIAHVYERVVQNDLLTKVVIATCDQEIVDCAQSIGARAVMTSDKHERASDRCQEALEIIEAEESEKYDIVVMIQGDEPLIEPNMITEAVQPMIDDRSILVTNLLGTIENEEEFIDPNCIKVVCDLRGNALFMSRNPIPSQTRTKDVPKGKQICVIPFRRDFLIEYSNLTPTPLEVAESVDMMRVIEHGFQVRMIPTKHKVQAVDTPEDLKKVEQIMSVAKPRNLRPELPSSPPQAQV